MFSRVRRLETFPGMHCEHVLRTFLEVVTEKKEIDCFKLFLDTASPTDFQMMTSCLCEAGQKLGILQRMLGTFGHFDT